ncbi:MAG: TolC family protein [Bacteroidales bacterium]|nr:TolC family protein [Bacteroidales bacterium]MCL2738455.1 TolC family protein [Bacteroidales bacterium]
MNVKSKIILIVFLLGTGISGWAQEVRLLVEQGVRTLDTASVLPLPYAQHEMGLHYSLMDCIEVALEENFSVRIARNQLEVAKNNVTLAPFLPSLSASARQLQTNNRSNVEYADDTKAQTESRTGEYRGGLNFSWRLFDGFAMFSSHARQKELLQSGELNFRSGVEGMVMDLSNQYYQIITIQNQVNLVQQLVNISRLRYEHALLRYELGNISGLECQQARIYFNADSSSLIVQRQNLKNAYIRLYRTMGVPYDSKIVIRDTIVPEKGLILDDLWASALERNTELLLLRQGQAVSEYDLRLAGAARYPTLDFSSSYTISAVNTPLANSVRYNETNGYNWGFNLSIPIFNGFTTNRQIRNARLGVERTALQYEQREQSLLGVLLQEYIIYTDNLQMIDFESQNAEVAHSNVEAAMERYRLGSLSGIEFRDIQLGYLNAVDRKLRSIYQAKLSEVALLLLAGVIF